MLSDLHWRTHLGSDGQVRREAVARCNLFATLRSSASHDCSSEIQAEVLKKNCGEMLEGSNVWDTADVVKQLLLEVKPALSRLGCYPESGTQLR